MNDQTPSMKLADEISKIVYPSPKWPSSNWASDEWGGVDENIVKERQMKFSNSILPLIEKLVAESYDQGVQSVLIL